MERDELRELLEKTKDKFEIVGDKDILRSCKLKVFQLLDAIKDFFTDEEKSKLFDLEHFKNLDPDIKKSIILLVEDEKLREIMLRDDNIVSDINKYKIIEIFNSFSEKTRIKFLKDNNFMKKYAFKTSEISDMIFFLDNSSKQKILLDKKLTMESLELEKHNVVNLVRTINDEDIKAELIEAYGFNSSEIERILKTSIDSRKKEVCIENIYNLSKSNIISLLNSMTMDNMIDFIANEKEYLKEKDIQPYNIIKQLKSDRQLEFLTKFEDAELSESEKKQILVILKRETKEKVNKSELPKEYIESLEMHLENHTSLKMDYTVEAEKYKGLDELIRVKPYNLNSEERKKLLEICKICPGLKIYDRLDLTYSTAEEYIEGEKWIETILNSLKEKWTDIQKIAYIDHAIGKKISYTPDHDTEMSDVRASKTFWKIVNSGYGVCNGIAEIEKEILSRINIDAETVSSGKHTFLLVKDILIPRKAGIMIKGNTIIDPTWNLASHRYDAKPDNFCRSYNEIRKHDIMQDGTDTESHKCEELENINTIDLEEKNLRELYKSIGLTCEKGQFPIARLLENSEAINNSGYTSKENLEHQINLIQEKYPNFATCQNSTAAVLKAIISGATNIKLDRCIIDRVYEANDEKRESVLYIFAQLSEKEKLFYYADKKTGKFLNLQEKEFIKKFKCYDVDLEKNDGIELWNTSMEIETEEELNKSSGTIKVYEGEEK